VLDERLQRLLPRIYAVGEESSSWSALLDEIREYLGSGAVALMTHDFARNRGLVCFSTGYNPKYLPSYPLGHARQNPWLSNESDYHTAGAIHVGEQLVPEVELVKTEFYTEWLKPQDLHHRLCAVLSRDRATAVFLEVMRARGWARFDQNDIERCRWLVPHLQRVLKIRSHIARLRTERDAALDTLDHLPWGVVLVDKQGGRLAANRCAQEILLAGDGLTMQGNTLRAALSHETARLDHLLRRSLNGAGDPAFDAAGAISITRSSGAHPLSVRVVPLRTKPDALTDAAPAAAIFISDPDLQLDSDEHHLRDLYALTAVEARLAACLSQGKSVDEAATTLGVTVNTARAYLKRIYNKTGVRRQPELVRLLLLGLTRLSEDQRHKTG
jgi:DNA-binding CsgD family transcriptional regulator